jgi:ubiquinone/menaquinone biosynthesis C-methylase UbiE
MLAAVDRVNAGGFGRPKSNRPDTHLRRVLDVAAGPGQPGLLIAERYKTASVEITDIAPDMVVQAAAGVAAAGHGDRVKCSVLDMNDMAHIDTASVDLVTVSFGLMFTSDLPRALSEIHRVLKPNGLLAASV